MASAFDPLKNDATRLGSSVKSLGSNAANAFETAFDATKTGGSGLGKFVLSPARVVLNVVRWPVDLASASFRRFPKLSVAGATLGVVGIATSFFRNRAEKRTQMAAMEEMMAPAQGASQSAYMNSVSPQEAAYMEAQMKQGAQAADHAATVQAAREKVPAPENAAAL
jgi:hypothetical protein